MNVDKSKFKLVSIILLIVFPIIYVVWDIITISMAGGGTTLSYIIKIASSFSQHFSIPFGYAVLGGHFFLHRNKPNEGIVKIIALGGLGTISIFVVSMDLINFFTQGNNWFINFISYNLIIPLIVGFFLGWGLWGQERKVKSN